MQLADNQLVSNENRKRVGQIPSICAAISLLDLDSSQEQPHGDCTSGVVDSSIRRQKYNWAQERLGSMMLQPPNSLRYCSFHVRRSAIQDTHGYHRPSWPMRPIDKSFGYPCGTPCLSEYLRCRLVLIRRDCYAVVRRVFRPDRRSAGVVFCCANPCAEDAWPSWFRYRSVGQWVGGGLADGSGNSGADWG